MKSVNYFDKVKNFWRRHEILLFLIAVILTFLIYRSCRFVLRQRAQSKAKHRFDQNLAISRDKHETVACLHLGLDKMSSYDLKKAVQVLHDGYPDRWTSDGRLVPGIPPDPIRAKNIYDELMRRGAVDVASSYGRLLEFGTPGREDLINHQKAFAAYQYHMNSLKDPYQKYEAFEPLERLAKRYDIYNMSPSLQLIKTDILNDIAAFKRYPNNSILDKNKNPWQIRTTDEDIWQLPLDAFRASTRPEDINIQGVRNDLHNAHDSGVTKTVRASVDRLRENIQNKLNISNIDASKQVRELINNSAVSADRKQNAIMALDTIERNNQYMTVADTTENDVLGLVWNRIHQPDNAEHKAVLGENLIDALSESVEHGKPTCASGRFNRIVNSLNGVDPLVDIKPKWAISKELIDKANVLYQEKIGQLNDEDRKAAEIFEPTAEQQVVADKVIGSIKSAIKDDFKSTYVDKGIMSQEALDVEVDKFIDHIA